MLRSDETFRRRLQEPRPLLLDGATGTELQRRGMPLKLPLWSAQALQDRPQLLQAIHRDYLQAGAEVITANTFRTHAHNLAPAGLANQAAELTALAVHLAREVAQDQAWVVGSQAPVEDCYHPERVPPQDQLRRAHEQMARHLAQAGVDAILVETQNTLREALAATQAALQTGLPVLVSFVCDTGARLLSGEPLQEAAEAVVELGVVAVLVNCVPAPWVGKCLEVLREVCPEEVSWGAYANTGQMVAPDRWVATQARNPQHYARLAQRWLELGARLLGGCCGTTPEHIAQLHKLLLRWSADRGTSGESA